MFSLRAFRGNDAVESCTFSINWYSNCTAKIFGRKKKFFFIVFKKIGKLKKNWKKIGKKIERKNWKKNDLKKKMILAQKFSSEILIYSWSEWHSEAEKNI